MKNRNSLTKRERLLAGLLGLLCLAAAITALALARAYSRPQVERAPFSPPPFDSNALAGTPEVDEALGWAQFIVREGYQFHVCGILTADAEGRIPLYFSSEADNTVWLRLRLRDANNTLLGQTGVIRPGEYVETLVLTNRTGSGTVQLEIMGYEPETYYSAGAVRLETVLTDPQN